MKQKAKRRIVLIVPGHGAFDIHPILRSLASSFARSGWRVAVLTLLDARFLSSTDQNYIKSLLPAWVATFSQRAMRVSGQYLPIMEGIWSLVAKQHLAAGGVFLGVDPWGLAVADNLARLHAGLAVYLSLELLLSYELQDPSIHAVDWWRLLKRRELRAARRVCIAIIQDRKRAELLSMDTGISYDRIFLLPNSTCGDAALTTNSHYFHRLFGIREDIRLALYVGSYVDWAMLPEIVSSIPQWPSDWALVLHSPYFGNLPRWLQEIADAPLVRNRLFISNSPLPESEYQSILTAADVGIATYKPVPGRCYSGDNIRFVGMSSGKMGQFLRCGVPVITSELPVLADMVRQWQCGQVIKSVEDIPLALANLSTSHDHARRQAVACYNSEWRFDPYFERIMSKMNDLVRGAR